MLNLDEHHSQAVLSPLPYVHFLQPMRVVFDPIYYSQPQDQHPSQAELTTASCPLSTAHKSNVWLSWSIKLRSTIFVESKLTITLCPFFTAYNSNLRVSKSLVSTLAPLSSSNFIIFLYHPSTTHDRGIRPSASYDSNSASFLTRSSTSAPFLFCAARKRGV